MPSSVLPDVAGTNYILVLKIGTSTLMSNKNIDHHAFSLTNIGKFVDIVCHLKNIGHKVVVISSGAVGAGIVAMHLNEKPKTFMEKQAVAAVGQCRLMRLYEDLFSVREERVAQLLITRTDFVDKSKYLSFRNVILELLKSSIIPIINENDSVASEMFRFGDNDTFASHCAASIAAHWLFILSDIDCLYNVNPRAHPDAKPIPYVDSLANVYKILDFKENRGTVWGSGGIISKIAAAKIATTFGIHTVIINGEYPERILSILAYAESNSVCYDNAANNPKEKHTQIIQMKTIFDNHSNVSCFPNYLSKCSAPAAPNGCTIYSFSTTSCGIHVVESLSDMPYIGTIFVALENKYCSQSMGEHRRWISSLPIKGKIWLDVGAVKAILIEKKSLFAAGIIKVQGKFEQGQAVSIHMKGAFTAQKHNDEIALCIVNFNSDDLNKIKGKKSEEFKNILKKDFTLNEIVHRSNIIFIKPSLHDGIYKHIFVEKLINEETKSTNTNVLDLCNEEEEENS